MSCSRRGFLGGMAGVGLGFAAPAFAGTQSVGGPAFGSSWRLTTHDTADLTRLAVVVGTTLDQINAQMSPYLAHSALSRFNMSDTNAWQDMPADLCSVASVALEIGNRTDGAFDPTVGPAVSHYGFGPIKGDIGSFHSIDVTRTALRKRQVGLTLDLCGIAKGFALDAVAKTLETHGVQNALIEIGGEVVCIGQHPDGRDWQVAIANPGHHRFEPIAIVSPDTLALATSGHSANALTGPISTSHIIDPTYRTPADTKLLSVSVLAATGIEADALATALCAMGSDAGIEFAKRHDVPAMFVLANGEEPMRKMTGRFAQHVLI